MFSPDYLARAAAIVGTDRLLFSTDYPYQYRPDGDARRFLAESGLAETDKTAFAHGNWERLTGGIALGRTGDMDAIPNTNDPLAHSD